MFSGHFAVEFQSKDFLSCRNLTGSCDYLPNLDSISYENTLSANVIIDILIFGSIALSQNQSFMYIFILELLT